MPILATHLDIDSDKKENKAIAILDK